MTADLQRRIADFTANPSVSFWLKDAIRAALKRDPVDALRDAEQLVAILEDVNAKEAA